MSDISHSTVIFQGYPWYMQNTKTYQQHNLHYSSSQPHRGDQAGSIHTVEAPAMMCAIPIRGGGGLT